MKENLESYFRNKLNESQDADGWNVPSDDIWEKAKPHFDSNEKKKRRFFFWWFGAGFLLCLFILGVSSYTIKKDSIASQVKLKENNQQIISPENNIPNEKRSQKLEEEAILIFQGKEKKAIPADYNTSKNGRNNSVSSLNSESIIDAFTFENKIPNQESIFNISLAEKERSYINLLKRLPSKWDLLSMEKELLKSVKLTAIKEGRGWSFDIHYVPTFSKLVVLESNNEIIGDNNKLLLAHNFGVGIAKRISAHWHLYSGLNYMQINSSNKTQSNSTYDASTEVERGGVMVNQLSFPTASPMGDIQLGLTMSHPIGVSIPSGDVIVGEFELLQKAIYLNIPIGVRYRNNINERYGWYTASGIDFNFELIQRNNFKGNMRHNNNTMSIDKMPETVEKTSITTPIFGHVGLGIERVIYKKLKLFTEVKYTHGLSYFAKAEAYKSKYKSINANIGIRIKF